MSSADGPREAGSARSLPDEVKSAILDQLLAELGADPAPHGRSLYTKSDSGLYGKYERADGMDEDTLREIRDTLQALIQRDGESR